ncbi:substrate-binding domain-containing protein [Sporomusa aerivorans]|uniref:substrate-binding domain-containing protein n=1 Tax=Sporomusa aerivorans TaxID=204936 RepID=UPI00352A73A4
MNNSTSYTPEEVSKILKISRFTVYEMIKRGDIPSYRIGRNMRIDAADLDTYIRNSKKHATPQSKSPAEKQMQESGDFIICGQDIVLDVLTRHLEAQMPHMRFLRNYIGSMNALFALYRKAASAATAHLWDSDSDTYNTPYVRRLLPGQHTLIFNLVYRNAGFYVAKGNPKNILDWQDLTRDTVRLINRESGAGARVLLDEMLYKLAIDSNRITGYAQEEMSHLAVASSVARGQADVAVGIEKVALQISGVDFIPLKQERYDIVIRQDDVEKPAFQALLSILKSQAFFDEVSGMGGYDLSQTGKLMAQL